MMGEILKVVLSLSLSGSLLILTLLLCKPLFVGKISKRWQYYIWLVVIARLFLPFAPETSLVGGLFRGGQSRVLCKQKPPRITQRDKTQHPSPRQKLIPR